MTKEGANNMKALLTVFTVLMLMFSAQVFADRYSDESEDAPNEADTDEAEDVPKNDEG